MANLIGGQRQDLKLDPFTSYLKTFTPSYSAYNEPFSPEEYNQRNLPFMDGMYNNPFTGGMSYKPQAGRNLGGQVSNGIMDLTNLIRTYSLSKMLFGLMYQGTNYDTSYE